MASCAGDGSFDRNRERRIVIGKKHRVNDRS